MRRLAENYNEELNPSGKAWPRSRGHDEVGKDPEEPSPEPATNVLRTEGEPETKEQLLASSGDCDTTTSVVGTYDIIITSSGHLYIDSRYDGTLHAQSLSLILGQFKRGNGAEVPKQDSTTLFEFKTTSHSATVMGRTRFPPIQTHP